MALYDNPGLTVTTTGCHNGRMTRNQQSNEATFQRIKEVRAHALEHTREAQRLAVERRDLMQSLIREGLSQADIARELGVTRQAIQKMLSV
jgi:transcriptional regulator with GAF, ATPase, and Fis domain